MKIITIDQDKKEVFLALKVSKKQKRDLIKVAKKSNVTISEAVRQLLDFGLKHVI